MSEPPDGRPTTLRARIAVALYGARRLADFGNISSRLQRPWLDDADAVIAELGLHQESDGFHGPAARTCTRYVTPWLWDDTGEIAVAPPTAEDSSLLAWGEEQLRLRPRNIDTERTTDG